MTNALYDSSLAGEQKSTSAADAALWHRFAAWGLDLAFEVALPYLLVVSGYVGFKGLQSLINNLPFSLDKGFTEVLFPTSLWAAFKQIDGTDPDSLNQTLALGTLFNSLQELLIIPIATLVLWVVFFAVNRLLLPTVRGKTLGKQLMGLRIETEKGEKPGFGSIFLRHVIGQAISSFFFLGYVYALVSSERRTWHDYIAGTRVVQEQRYQPQLNGNSAISSALVHLESFVLAIFFVYFLKLLVIWLRILGVPIPAILLPEQQPPAPPIEFTLVEPTPNQGKKPSQAKRRSAVTSVAAGKRDPKQPVAEGSPASRPSTPKRTPRPQEPKPEPKPREEATALPKPPTPAATQPKPVDVPPDVVTTPAPAPVSVAPEQPRRTRASQALGDTLASNPSPTPPVRASRTSNAGSLGSPLSVGSNNKQGTGPGGRGNSQLFNPDRSGEGDPGIDSAQDVDFGPYMNQLQRRVKRAWFAPEQSNSRRTVLRFTIERNGQVSELKVSRSSGNATSDQAAIDAVRRAAPFPPLPSAYRGDEIEITFTFDINVFGGEADTGSSRRGY
ncbi:TonB family protein [Anthocerotibacter panamensis]|uniref:TonB family protein n=1 Tax=Anthocerotibacter panamensis TaxID=2857077 RepID=UPI001C40572F|nr:TonB family protein [Anthocerotibacter panamensis]